MATPSVDLPITRVVLYSSGVGYFEHEGTVEGDAVMQLLFSAEQINDVLRSLVLADLDGGSIRSVSYPSQEPLERSLQSFEVDIAEGLSVAELLRQVRGSSVRIYASDMTEGIVLDVESERQVARETDLSTTIHTLLLRTARGIESIPLADVQRFELTEPRLQEELDQAVALRAAARNTQRRPLDVQFSGKGVRRVRLGYLQEAAVWKTSYRLDLTAEVPRLQGWAMIDNASGTDWKDVRLSLVSGRPLAFVPDLYSPRHVRRPGVSFDQQARLPEHLEQGMSSAREAEARGDPARVSYADHSSASSFRQLRSTPTPAPTRTWQGLEQGVDAQARGEAVGELVEFTLEQRATIPRRSSATLPLLVADANAKRASVYDPSLCQDHPLCAATIRNLSDTTWMPGPITVYDGGIYAGDGSTAYVPRGSRRLVTYAVDLDVRVKATSKDATASHVVATRPEHLVVEVWKDQIRAFRLHNKSRNEKNLILKQDIYQGAELLVPTEAWQEAEGQYLFLLQLAPGEQRDFSVVQRGRSYSLEHPISIDRSVLDEWTNALSEASELRPLLDGIRHSRRQLVELEKQGSLISVELEHVIEDQQRVRRNLADVGAHTTVGSRYLAKLDDQESQIETLRTSLTAVKARIVETRQEVLDAMSVEESPA